MSELILALHTNFHDASAALYEDYELRAAVQLERLTRHKGDGRQHPDLAANMWRNPLEIPANGIDDDFHVASARGENAELELHDEIAGQPGTVRLLGFANHARMGRYADAIAAFQRGEAAAPDVTASRAPGRITYGAGLNVEHAVTDQLRGFARLGWNTGHNESFAYTEVDNTAAVGVDLRGAAWHRGGDQLGVAAVSSGLSDAHRRYLALGGKGFLLGDGQLRYGRELVVETYYTARLWRGVAAAGDVQVIGRPGFNRDRGPVAVGSLRLHVEL